MDLRDTPEEAEYRSGVRRWLAENLPDGWGKPGFEWPGGDQVAFLRDWSRRLYEAGYVGLNWPEEHGGHLAPVTYQAVINEEFARAEAPAHVGLIGIAMAGPTIIFHGTDGQKSRFLRPMLTGEEIWCQGFSEPGSGSDLASLQARAVADGDDFVITGQKVWSSFAHVADWCFMLARTDPEAPKHEGITFFLVDMRSEGVETRPLRQITGDEEFNEIFFDGVRVPRSQVVGEINDGWRVAITTLMHERAGLGLILGAATERRFGRLLALAREAGEDGDRSAERAILRDRIAALYADVQALRLTNWRALSDLVKKGAPGPEGSIAKLHFAETNQALGRAALDVLGPAAQLDGPSTGMPGEGYWQHEQLRSLGNSIEGGTSEVLRNIIAERVLGLPKSR